MSNRNNNHNNEKDHDKDQHSGKQGFASMDKEKVKEIASKGGQTTHKGEHNDHDDDSDHRKSKSHNKEDNSDDEKDNRGRNKHDNDHDEEHHSGKQGFASMPKEQVREIASKGGQASHKNDENKDNNKKDKD